MMKKNTFSSADFGMVPSQLRPHCPEHLLHKNVLQSGVAGDENLSSKRQHLVRTVNLPSLALSMTIGGLNPRQATRRHRHNYETLIYVLEGEGRTIIEDREVLWFAGDALYIPVWTWHQHINISSDREALYVACENSPLLQNLGTALREES